MNDKSIVIVDDHFFILEGWKVILSQIEGMKIGATCSTGSKFLEYYTAATVLPDIVIIDIQLPDINGLKLLEKIRKTTPNQKVIISTFSDDLHYFKKALQLEVQGFLLKDEDVDQIIDCVTKVSQGDKYYPRALRQKLFFNMGKEEQEITPKEKIILVLISEGFTNKKIANIENISVRTVETHRHNLMRKMDAKNVAELIQKCTEKGILN